MIDFQEARRIAQREYGPECVLVDDATIEKPYGWVFFATSRQPLKTRDNYGDEPFGSEGLLIERASGNVLPFGYPHPTEAWLATYERGLLTQRYDLTISSVQDPAGTVRLLNRIDIRYTLPEEEHGVVWRIERGLTPSQLTVMLKTLPITVPNLCFAFRDDLFEELRSTHVCTLCLTEYAPDEALSEEWQRRCAEVDGLVKRRWQL